MIHSVRVHSLVDEFEPSSNDRPVSQAISRAMKAVCWWRAQELGTFGFRGEALSSLCALAEVAVVTRTAEMAAGVRLAYDQAGAVLSQASAARAVGTTVAVRDLFKPLPVRYKVAVAVKRGLLSLAPLLLTR